MAAPAQVGPADLLEVDLGPGARGYFTTRGPGAGSSRGARGQDRGPYAGWNLAAHVGDDPRRVAAHRRRLEELVGLGGTAPRGLGWMNQVHSADVAQALVGCVPTADALVAHCGQPQAPAGVCVMVADCVPLLLATGDGSLVAAVHAGRRGMLDGVVPAALRVLARAGAGPAELWAALGPSICGSCYEVPREMQRESAQREPACASLTRWGTPGLDVAAGVLAQLERAGVGHIRAAPWCTMEDPRFFSYRRDGVTGRLAGVALPRRAAADGRGRRQEAAESRGSL